MRGFERHDGDVGTSEGTAAADVSVAGPDLLAVDSQLTDAPWQALPLPGKAWRLADLVMTLPMMPPPPPPMLPFIEVSA